MNPQAPEEKNLPRDVNAEEAQTLKEKRDLERMIHPMLRWGVLISSAIMLVGLLMDVLRGRPVPESVPPLDQIIPQVLTLQPSGFLALGLLVLIATPILRVAGSVIAFIYEKDWRYALITLIVFLIVLASIFFGRG